MFNSHWRFTYLDFPHEYHGSVSTILLFLHNFYTGNIKDGSYSTSLSRWSVNKSVCFLSIFITPFKTLVCYSYHPKFQDFSTFIETAMSFYYYAVILCC